MLSGSVWYFSDLFAEKLETGEETVEVPEHYACPECGKSYPTEQQLRGHLSGHARQKEAGRGERTRKGIAPVRGGAVERGLGRKERDPTRYSVTKSRSRWVFPYSNGIILHH